MKLSSRVKKGIIICLSFIVVILFIAVINKNFPLFGVRNRTIMIYMSGNNLESSSGLATVDLESIIPSEVNLDRINILVYTGSTKKWHNSYVDNNENAIFLLTNNGYKKINVYHKKSLGDVDSFKDFLDYSYQNYQADRYDLIFWDHGLGALGSIDDEYSNDWLSATEMGRAFGQSSFKNVKLETILFRTCLNSTLEVASELAPYAKYMIASEEITMGASNTSVLNFLNHVELNDNGIEYGRKFIQSYQKQIDDIEKRMKFSFSSEDIDSTYSILDLSMIPDLIHELDSFFSGIDVSNDYSLIAKVRSTLHQYAKESSDCVDYDTVDLYELIDGLKSLSKHSGDKLLSLIKKTVKDNWSTNSHSNGISIYMPYYGDDSVKKLHFELYEHLRNNSVNYKKFINNFYQIQKNPSDKVLNFLDNHVELSSNKEFSMQLTDEQRKYFTHAKYLVFRKEEDDYYTPIYASSDIVEDNGVIRTKLDNNLLMIVDKTGDGGYIFANNISSINDKKEYVTPGVFHYMEGDMKDWKTDNGFIHIKIGNDNIPYISQILNHDDVNGRVIDLKDFTYVDFMTFRYKILDEQGNYNPKWKSYSTYYGYEFKIDEFELKRTSLDDSDNYYCVFMIYDVNNNVYYSKLIKIN